MVGCIPLYIFYSEDGQRQLKLLGTGNSDYLDLLIKPEFYEAVLDNVLKFLNNIKGEYDIIEFHGQREGALILNYIQNNPEIEYKIINEDVSPVTELPNDFKNFISTLSVHLRKNILRAEREFTVLNYALEKAERGEVPLFLENFISLHNAEWAQQNKIGVLHNKTVIQFLHESVMNAVDNNACAIYALKNESGFAAVNIIFHNSNTAYYYIGAYNIALQKYSPGSVILWKIIQDCINNGITYFDFLKGAEPYKYRWNAKDQKIFSIQINV